MALLALAGFGWGSLLVWVLGARRAEQARRLGAPMRVALGLSLFLFAGGIAVAADFASFGFLFAWQILGGALGLGALATRWRGRRGSGPSLLSTLGVTLGGLLVALVALGSALNGPYNANDDGPAYLYLAQRLLSTGGLIDPFNTRRVDSYGGGELFQALVLRTSANSAVLGVEWFFFALLLVALFTSALPRRLLLPGLLLVGLGVVLVHPVGVWANVAPTFSGAALSLASLQLLAGARRGASDPWRFLLTGALLGGLASLRLEFVLPVVLATGGAALVVVRGRAAWRAIGIGALGGLLTTLPWAIALWRSSRTPFFPLFAGDLTDAVRAHNPAMHGAGALLGRLGDELSTDHFGLIVFGSLLLAGGLCLALRHLVPQTMAEGASDSPSAALVVLFLFVLGCVAEAVLLAFSLSGAALSDVGRYDAPSALAALLFALDLVLGECDRLLSAPSGDRRALRPVGALGALLGAALFLVALGDSAVSYASALRQSVPRALDLVAARSSLVDDFAAARPSYARLNALVPLGTRVLAAVELPGLLEFSRFSFSTLDVPGGASPAPHLPLESGPRPLVAYLRALGYEGIVATLPGAPGLYNLAAAQANTTSGIYYYRVTAEATVAWDDDLSQLRGLYHFQRVGRLLYLPFSEPRAAVAGAHRRA